MKISELWHIKKGMIRKMWLNQFAFSLFGLFVASALSGNLCVVAGIFSLLFYLSVVGFAILDDAQKDKIIHQAGRGEHRLSASVGLRYCWLCFAPTLLLIVGYAVYSFVTVRAAGVFHTVYFLIVKYVLAGEILGIDVGLTRYTYDAVNQVRASTASPAVLFMSDHALFQLIFAIVVPCILGIVYSLAFRGVISFNTTSTKEK